MSIDEMNPREPGYFKRLRFNPHFHLGMGDVRLTLAMQGEIEKAMAALQAELTDAQCRAEEAESERDILGSKLRKASAAMEALQEALE